MRFLDAHSVEEEKQALARDAIEFVERYEGLDYAYDRLEQEINKAVTSLSVIDDSPARDYLVAFARYMSVREH
jgi:geranylgeranyl pyrophosphate synthase